MSRTIDIIARGMAKNGGGGSGEVSDIKVDGRSIVKPDGTAELATESPYDPETNPLATMSDVGGGSVDSLIEETTWSQLKAKRDAGQLTPGMKYRITDYVTTTKNSELFRSAGHPFDLIVTAISNNKLGENAQAILHSDEDNYFNEVITEVVSADWINPNIQITEVEPLYNLDNGEVYNDDLINQSPKAAVITQLTKKADPNGLMVPAMLNPNPDGDGGIKWHNNTVQIYYSMVDDESSDEPYHLGRNVIVGCGYKNGTPMLKLGDPIGVNLLDWNGDYLLYRGQQLVDGQYYDKWLKYDIDDVPQEYYWLTNIIVEDNTLTVTEEQVEAGLEYEVIISPDPDPNDCWYIFKGFIEVDGETLDVWYEWNSVSGFDEQYNIVTNHIVEAETISHFTQKANLSAWQIKYNLDNDVSKFDWADESTGKGVIYWMKDEWNNECPYDFKNIQFKRYYCASNNAVVGDFHAKFYGIKSINYPESTAPLHYTINNASSRWYYTFSGINQNDDLDIHDMSIPYKVSEASINYVQGDGGGCDWLDNCHDNKIQPLRLQFMEDDLYNLGKMVLNNIVMFGWFFDDHGAGEYPEVGKCYNNIFGVNCCDMTFGARCRNLQIGAESRLISVAESNLNHQIGKENTFLNLGGSCVSNIIGNNCTSNELANGCQFNRLEGNNNGISFASGCRHNVIESLVTIVNFGMDCQYNKIQSYTSSVTFGRACTCNQVGLSCYGIKFGTSNSVTNDCSCNIIDPWVRDVMITANAVDANHRLQNIHVHSGVSSNSILVPVVGQDYSIDYYANNSQERFI